MRLIDPVIVRPLTPNGRRENRHRPLLAKSKKQNDKAYKDAAALFHGHLERLRNFRVLDAACGSGNFPLPRAARAEGPGTPRQHRSRSPRPATPGQHRRSARPTCWASRLDAYAAELARVTVWIGEIQWMLKERLRRYRRSPS
jgi:hypothetical protein